MWGICKGCGDEQPLAILSTYAGPIYSFSIIWIGYFLLSKPSAGIKSVGLALIVSSMPFSRIITPLFGGGDEVYALNTHLNNHLLAWALGLTIVLLLAIPPVVKMWNTIRNRKKVLWIVGLLLVPFLMTGAVVFGILQTLLLENGFMSDYWILGSPELVTAWFFFCLVVLLFTGNSLPTLLQPGSSADEK